MIEYQEARRIAGILAAVGEPTRMLILHQLTQSSQYVGQLSEQLGIPMVNMSHHLGVMRQAGLVEDSKQGRRVLYTVNPEIFSSQGPQDSLGVLDLGHVRLILNAPSANGDSESPKGKTEDQPAQPRRTAKSIPREEKKNRNKRLSGSEHLQNRVAMLNWVFRAC
ncbi:MAG: metalloregulator ArsR/SmtB family transcription factor [Bacteroidales bacterium]|nr:metalloregulator ArsR/SmtB family transcription factor [Bacteroidales bacterium]